MAEVRGVRRGRCG